MLMWVAETAFEATEVQIKSDFLGKAKRGRPNGPMIETHDFLKCL
jgi:hypothetical protein